MAANREVTPYEKFRFDLEKAKPEFHDAFPSQYRTEEHFNRFKRVMFTAVQKDPKLLAADRRSLIGEAIKCATDGLLPDGREAALVRFFDSKKSIDMVTYMPMTYGLIKLARQSGEVALLTARCVYAGDKFRYWIDEEGEHIIYEPSDTPPDNLDNIKAVFAMAKLKDGTVYMEPMSVTAVEKRRSVSKMSAGPKSLWEKWKPEMYVKTAIKQLMKRLPRIVDLEDVIDREDMRMGLAAPTIEHEAAPKPRQQAAITHTKEEAIGNLAEADEEREREYAEVHQAEELEDEERREMPDERSKPKQQDKGKTVDGKKAQKKEPDEGDEPTWLKAFEHEASQADSASDLQELYDAVWDGPASKLSPRDALATRIQAVYSRAKARIQGYDPETGEISE